MASTTVKLKITGPIKRSTFQTSFVDPVSEGIEDILHWSWSTRLQLTRLRQSFDRELYVLTTPTRRLPQRKSFSRTTFDEHLIFVAAANLDRALGKAPKAVKRHTSLPQNARRSLRLLRDIYEHWDQLRRDYRSGNLTGAAAKLKKEFPGADPWSFTFDPFTSELILADVVPVSPLRSQLRLLEARMLRLQRANYRAGIEVSS